MSVYYDKYERGGAVHWNAYRYGLYNYKPLIDSSLEPFVNAPRGSVLELGVGDGVSAHLLTEMGFHVYGVDYNKRGFELLKENTPHWDKIETELIDIGLYMPDRVFDYMYSVNTIEHVENPKVFVELMKSVKEFAVIVTDDAKKLGRGSRYHHQEFTPESLVELFKDFKVEMIPIGNPQFFGIKIYANKT